MKCLFLVLFSTLALAQPREATCTIIDTGSDDDYAGLCPAGTTSVRLMASFANIGGATLSIDGGVSSAAVKHGGASDLADNTVPGNARVVRLHFDGTYWQIETPAGSSGGGGPDPWTTIDLVDEFIGGGVASTVIGELGWYITGGSAGSVSLASQDPGVWGYVRRNTAATANSFATMYVANGGNLSFPSGGNWTLTWRVKAGSAFDANTVVQVGASCASNLTTDPAHAIYFRASGASSTWQSVTRSYSNETANDTTFALGTGWHKLTIRRIDENTIGFRVNNNAETAHTTNISAFQCNPWISVTNGATAAVQSLDIEYFRLQAAGVVR